MPARIAVLLPLLLFVAIGLRVIHTTPFPAFDEVEHISFAATMKEREGQAGWLRPDYLGKMSLERTDFSRRGPYHDYIGHPLPYYVFVGQVLDRSLPPDRAILAPRLASFALMLLAVLLMLHAGMQAFGRDTLALGVFAGLVALCPELLSVVRQVNNDALGVLGGALAIWSVLGRGAWRDAAAGLGLMLALWAKPNAGVEAGLLLALFLLLSGDWRLRRLAALAAGGLLGVLPYADLLLRYGKLVPIAAEDVNPVPSLDSWAEYVPTFLRVLGTSWGYMRSAIWPLPGLGNAVIAGAFWAAMAGLAWGAVRWDARGRLPRVAVAVFAVVCAVHLWFSGTRLGFSLTAPSFRYYLPIWPALAFGVALGVQTGGRWRWPIACGAAVLLAVGFLP